MAFTNSTILEEDIYNINDRIQYWFKPEQIGDLLKLRTAIYTSIPPKSFYRKFFISAFSNILKPTSVWLTKSIKPQVDPEKEPANVFMAFASQIKMMIKANSENQINNSTNVKIENINFLEKKINKSYADLIVTSPPYVTSYEYADLHQLSSLWIDFTDDYKSFREGTIGSLYHNSNYNSDLDVLNKTGKEIILQLYKVDKRKNH